MNKRFIQFLQIILVGLDLIVLNVLNLIVFVFFEDKISPDVYFTYYNYWIVLNFCWLFFSFTGQVYSITNILSFEYFSKKTGNSYINWILIISLYLFFNHSFELSRLYIVSSLLLFGFGLLLNRFAYLGLRLFFKTKSYFKKRIIIIGYNEVSKKLAVYLEEDDDNTEMLGFMEDSKNIKELTTYPILSDINRTLEIATALNVNEIYSTITPEQDNLIYKLMVQAESSLIRFKIVPDISFFIHRNVYIDYIKDIPILSLRKEPLIDFSNIIKKRLFDIVFSFFVIVFILSWLIPVISLFIWLDSGMPIFFSQIRTGINNKKFSCLKFRSMRVNKDAHTNQASKNDKRVTKIGRILRKTSLDEFPQFFNVFKGEMSIVGPRPHMVKHTEDYSKQHTQFMLRHFLKPGITGWAQVNGYRGEISEQKHLDKRIEHDLWYLENWSVWLDVKIIFLTVYNVFKGEQKAY